METESDPSAPDARSRVRVLPFREDMVSEIARAIGASVELAPFQLPGAKVFQVVVDGAAGRPTAMLTLWPSLRRADAISAGAAVVFTQIVSVQVVDDVEVLFRRETGEYLVVAIGGRIIVRS